ncbi:hypothetical protein B0H10DRAFT_1952838 [Mycena sp. CBHHK59/15]|nr:hypothetical protein B0H10DRAFT_1952838 [Mycena sp. CBHHK59/15]
MTSVLQLARIIAKEAYGQASGISYRGSKELILSRLVRGRIISLFGVVDSLRSITFVRQNYYDGSPGFAGTRQVSEHWLFLVCQALALITIALGTGIQMTCLEMARVRNESKREPPIARGEPRE